MDVLELGAGAGLPSLVVAKSGARTVRASVSFDRVVIDVTGVGRADGLSRSSARG
jgi:predicted nicotinamide N-methyase